MWFSQPTINVVVFFCHGSDLNIIISLNHKLNPPSPVFFFKEIIFIQSKYEFIVLTFTFTTFLPGKRKAGKILTPEGLSILRKTMGTENLGYLFNNHCHGQRETIC